MKRSVLMGALAVLLVGGAIALVVSQQGSAIRGPIDLVPGDAQAYGQLSTLPTPVAGAEAIVRHLGFGMFIRGARKGVKRQLGFDPFDREALLERGIDPDRPIAGYLPGDSEELVMLLPVKDPARVRTTLTELWQDRMGGTVEAAEVEGHSFDRALDRNGSPGSAWACRDGSQVVAPGAAAAERIATVLVPGGAPRLGQQPTFRSAWETLGPGADLFVWALPKGVARANRQLKAMEEGLDSGAFSLTLGTRGLELGLFGDLGAVAATALPVFLEADAKATRGLLDRLYPEAVLVGRFSISPTEMWSRLVQLPSASAAESLEAELRARGIELTEVLSLFTGQMVAGLSPVSDVQLSRMPALDLRRTNPFAYLQAELRLALGSPDKIRGLLPQAAEALAPALRAEVSRSEIDGVEVFTIRYHLGEGMSFGVIGSDLVATGGEGAFARAIARHAASGPGYGQATRKAPFAGHLRTEGSVGAVLQVDRLLMALGEVNSQRLGGGPGGMAAALAFRKLRSTLEKIDHLSLVVEPQKSAIETRVNLRFTTDVVPPAQAAGTPKP